MLCTIVDFHRNDHISSFFCGIEASWRSLFVIALAHMCHHLDCGMCQAQSKHPPDSDFQWFWRQLSSKRFRPCVQAKQSQQTWSVGLHVLLASFPHLEKCHSQAASHACNQVSFFNCAHSIVFAAEHLGWWHGEIHNCRHVQINGSQQVPQKSPLLWNCLDC